MIRAIVAVDQKMGIAKHGGQPWHIPDDEAYFSRQTKLYGGNVLMGSKTLAVMGEPLKGRNNFVLTRSQEHIDGVTVLHSLDKVNETCGEDNVWSIGGASLYSQMMEAGLLDELYVTHIAADFNCDKFFPAIPKAEYKLYQQSEPKQQNGFTYTYAVYKKVAAHAAT
ncbi:MAG: dihydrofolate reductase [Patescibacteria group bacterium]|nr:dihydrofolate reductase [Patescibacteria group bacterium]